MKTLSEAELAEIKARNEARHRPVELLAARAGFAVHDRHELLCHIDALNACIAELEDTIDKADEHTAWLMARIEALTSDHDKVLAYCETLKDQREAAYNEGREDAATAILRALPDCNCSHCESVKSICTEHGAE